MESEGEVKEGGRGDEGKGGEREDRPCRHGCQASCSNKGRKIGKTGEGKG